MLIVRFEGVLGKQLVELGKTITAAGGEDENMELVTVTQAVVISASSQESDNTSFFSPSEQRVHKILQDNSTGINHQMLQCPLTRSSKTGKEYCKICHCSKCSTLMANYCDTCGVNFCSPTKSISCDCFAEYLQAVHHSSGRLSLELVEEGVE